MPPLHHWGHYFSDTPMKISQKRILILSFHYTRIMSRSEINFKEQTEAYVLRGHKIVSETVSERLLAGNYADARDVITHCVWSV